MMSKTNTNPDYHGLHVRIEMPLWKRLRRTFPEYGALKYVVNKSIEDFLDKMEDIDGFLAKCEKIQYERRRAQQKAKLEEAKLVRNN
jgi:hypothetical protein